MYTVWAFTCSCATQQGQAFLLRVVNTSQGLGSGPKTRCNNFVTIQDLGALSVGSMIHSSSIAYAVRWSCSI